MTTGAQAPQSPWTGRVAIALIVVATVLSYANSFSVPFIFDDQPTILENPTIRHLWPLTDPLSPPRGTGITTEGRPLVNLSLAINYALGGFAPAGYHLFNLAIHVLAGLTLFGVARRTLLQPRLHERFGEASLLVAFAVALLWTVHPLQTESVTYVVQRAESLVGLFYLLTLYAFIRGASAARPWWWYSISGAACLCGMASKEIMASVPLLVILYDRTFLADSFRAAWKQRWKVHSTLAVTWLLLAWLVVQSGSRGATAGFGSHARVIDYAFTQCGAVVHYLRLAIWPSPLVFDYGRDLVMRAKDILPQALLLGALVAAFIVAIVRRSTSGFLGAVFFAVLAPSSSIVPVVTQTMAEHRMYLALAPLVTLAVCGAFRIGGKRTIAVFLALACVFVVMSHRRNGDYATEVAIWRDTATKLPRNVRAHFNLGNALSRAGDPVGAIAKYEDVLRIEPGHSRAHYNMGNLLTAQKRFIEAIAHYEQSIQSEPNSAEAHYNLANVLVEVDRSGDAIRQFEEALRLDPYYPNAHYNLANTLASLRRLPEAISRYRMALSDQPDFAEAHCNLGNVLFELGRATEAAEHYEQAVRLEPLSAETRRNLAVILISLGKTVEARRELQAAIGLQPSDSDARALLRALDQPK